MKLLAMIKRFFEYPFKGWERSDLCSHVIAFSVLSCGLLTAISSLSNSILLPKLGVVGLMGIAWLLERLVNKDGNDFVASVVGISLGGLLALC